MKHWPARPFAFAFCDTNGKTAYFRWEVDPYTRRVIPGPDREQQLIRNVLTSPDVTLIGHNIAYDFRMVYAAGLGQPQGSVHDTQVLAHVVTAGDELSYGLKPLAKKYVAFDDADEKILELAVQTQRKLAKAKGWLIAIDKKAVERGEHGIFSGNKPVKADYWLAPPDLCQAYATGDVERTMLLFLLWYESEVRSNPRTLGTYLREMDLFWTLRRMEYRGTRTFPAVTAELVEWYKTEMTVRRAQIDAMGYPTLNFNSTQQLSKIFYEEKGNTPYYTDTFNPKLGRNNYKLGKDQLAMLGAMDPETGDYKDPLAKAILEYRAAHQSIKSFLNIYPYFWYPESIKKNVWILHPNYNQTGAVTGRMTCSDPNLQQVADASTGLRKADIASRPRECFGPRPFHLWYLPDYSQVEVWLFAFMSGERKMQEQLLAGHDFHSAIAKLSFSRKPDFDARPGYYRKLAKLIMFGKLYGGGVGTPERPGRMTKLLQMPFHEAKAFIDGYEAEFQEVKRFMKRMVREAEQHGEAFNLYGRRYRLEKEWAYKVVNYLIQGSAADLLKMALIRLDWMLRTRWRDEVRMLNSIHDEIMIEVPYRLHCMRLMREIVWVMQMDSERIGLPVPLPVGIKVSTKQWAFKTDIPLLPWVRGGVPRGADDAQFDDLRAHMAACPYLDARYDHDHVQSEIMRREILSVV